MCYAVVIENAGRNYSAFFRPAIWASNSLIMAPMACNPVAHGRTIPPRFEVEFAIRRRLQSVDECLPRGFGFQAAELLRGNDDDLVTSVNGDVLRSLAACQTHEFAEPRAVAF